MKKIHLVESAGILQYNERVFVFRGFFMDALKQKLKETIISSLQLEDIKPENIVDEAPLFNEGLGLDSIDALELGVALKKNFGIKFATEGEDTKKIFASVDSLAQYIAAERAKAN